MTDFKGKRFDDRILDREDDGGAFERFVDECLRLEAPGKTLVRGLARGADGAIDLADADQRLKHVVECKFVGSDSKSTAVERWNEVRRHLEGNLLPLAQGDENRRKRYRPWLKSEGDLEEYTFITSTICASADERNQLRRLISDFFVKQSKAHEELSHLRDVKVDLRYWDDLIGQSARFTPLFYRWFGGFPQGYGDLELSFGSQTGFKQFLASRNLPYFSRDCYMLEIGQDPVSQLDAVLQHLTQGNEARTHVIFGPGGVGKTRLSIEVCEKARDSGWWPIRLDRKASVSKLDSLCQGHADSAKLLLFIDYAEAFEELDRLPEAVSRLANDGKHRISVLASTRSSSLQRVTDRLIGSQPEATDVSVAAVQNGYASWLVRKIIGHFDIPQSEAVARACKGLPAMAAFAGFLFQRDRAQFDMQFGNLAAVKDFTDWSAARLKMLEDRFPMLPVQAVLAELAVRLPIPKAEAYAFRDIAELQRNVFDILKVDRWIEDEGDTYSAAHDVLADAILARYLSAMPGGEQDRLQDVAVAALLDNRLDRCLAALDRLGDHPVFVKLSGMAMIETLMRRDSERTILALPALVKSRLMHPAELIALLASSDVLRARLADLPQAHLPLAQAGEWAATRGRSLIDRATADLALNAPLGSAVAFQHPNNMVLRCAHAFDPTRFHDDVIERLHAAPGALDSHYLIVSLLKWGTQPPDVLPHLALWLAGNSTAAKASFVYAAWLDAKGEVEAVREKLLLWVAAHGSTQDAQFVYKAWLDAKGEVEAVREKLLLWVATHGTTHEASHVYAAWLDAKGEVEAVREKLLLWVAAHGTTQDARFVYKAWLDAKGEVESVLDQISIWLLKYWHLEEAFFATKKLSKRYPIPPRISACIAAHSGLHADNADSVFRLSSASRALRDEGLSPRLALIFIKSSRCVVDRFLKRIAIQDEEVACSILLSNICTLPMRGQFWSDTLHIFSCLVAEKSPIINTLRLRNEILVLMLHDSLALGFLDPKNDQDGIELVLMRLKSLLPVRDLRSLIKNGYLPPPLSAIENK